MKFLLISFIKASIVILLFQSCEYEQITNGDELHPFTEEVPVLFGFLQLHECTTLLEVHHTLPVYSLDRTAYVNDAMVNLYADELPLATLSVDSQGIYTGNLPSNQTINTEAVYRFDVQAPDFSTVTNEPIRVPEPLLWESSDTFTTDGRFFIQARLANTNSVNSVSTRALYFGGGSLINSHRNNLLPVAEALDLASEPSQLDFEFSTNRVREVFLGPFGTP